MSQDGQSCLANPIYQPMICAACAPYQGFSTLVFPYIFQDSYQVTSSLWDYETKHLNCLNYPACGTWLWQTCDINILCHLKQVTGHFWASVPLIIKAKA